MYIECERQLGSVGGRGPPIVGMKQFHTCRYASTSDGGPPPSSESSSRFPALSSPSSSSSVPLAILVSDMVRIMGAALQGAQEV